jgi:hypothetical protein
MEGRIKQDERIFLFSVYRQQVKKSQSETRYFPVLDYSSKQGLYFPPTSERRVL